MDSTQTSINVTGITDDTITLSTSYPWSNTVHGGGFSITNLPSINYPNVNITTGSNTSPYTMSGTYSIGAAGATSSPWVSNTVSPKIQLNGEDADIEVNGWSLVTAIKLIEEQLAIMQPNLKLESEWAELKQLGDQYRKLEQHIRDKQATWDRLKAMTPPVID